MEHVPKAGVEWKLWSDFLSLCSAPHLTKLPSLLRGSCAEFSSFHIERMLGALQKICPVFIPLLQTPSFFAGAGHVGHVGLWLAHKSAEMPSALPGSWIYYTFPTLRPIQLQCLNENRFFSSGWQTPSLVDRHVIPLGESMRAFNPRARRYWPDFRRAVILTKGYLQWNQILRLHILRDIADLFTRQRVRIMMTLSFCSPFPVWGLALPNPLCML